jgi:hypothetical protein
MGAMRFSAFCLLPPLALILTASYAAGASRTILENEKVRVVEAVDQPHSPSAPHQHKSNRVMIYLQPGSQRIAPQGGAPVQMQWTAGEVKWSPAGGMHVSEVTSSAPVTIIEVELKGEANPAKRVTTALDPAKVDPQDYHVEFENPQVRVVRVRMGPKHAVPLHEHQLDRVVVYLTDQDTKITTPDGKSEVVRHKAGEASWGGATKHREENLDNSPFEAVVVELKY